MTFHTLVCGLALVILGVGAYANATPKEDGGIPMTSLIPAFFGVPLILCAAIVILKESLRKHVMHTAAMIGLLGFLGGFAPIIRTVANGGEFDLSKPSIRTGVLMSAVCLAFVFLCVKSFIDARKAREANPAL